MKNQCYQNWQLPFSKGLLLLTLLILQQLNLFAQCSPDIVAPSILCPANLTVTVAPGICSTAVTLTAPIVNDNCPGPVTLTSTAPSNSVYPLGTTPVVFTATDAAGNPTTCQTTVTVSGGFIYTLVCNDLITVPAHPSGITTLVPDDILEGGPYNCVETSIAQGVNGTCMPSISIAGTGTFQISACVALPGGGFNRCWGNVTITGNACSPDVTPPTAVCVNALTIQSNLNGPNTTLLNPQVLDNGSFDACSALTYRATLDITATTPPVSSAAVPIVGIGTQDVALWVGDAA
ncbi:MAG: HYR domain-containing protein, partial [Saprospiraceae bacterium]